MSIRDQKPPDHYTQKINDLYYKVGKYGIVFVWIDGAWIRSTKTVDEVIGKK